MAKQTFVKLYAAYIIWNSRWEFTMKRNFLSVCYSVKVFYRKPFVFFGHMLRLCLWFVILLYGSLIFFLLIFKLTYSLVFRFKVESLPMSTICDFHKHCKYEWLQLLQKTSSRICYLRRCQPTSQGEQTTNYNLDS